MSSILLLTSTRLFLRCFRLSIFNSEPIFFPQTPLLHHYSFTWWIVLTSSECISHSLPLSPGSLPYSDLCHPHLQWPNVLVWVSSEADAEMKIGVQVIYLRGGVPRIGEWDVKQGRESSQKVCYQADCDCGSWGLVLLGHNHLNWTTCAS